MARTPYSDPDAEAAYQDMADNSSKAPDFNRTFDDAERSNARNYTAPRLEGLVDTGTFKRNQGSFPPGKK